MAASNACIVTNCCSHHFLSDVGLRVLRLSNPWRDASSSVPTRPGTAPSLRSCVRAATNSAGPRAAASAGSAATRTSREPGGCRAAAASGPRRTRARRGPSAGGTLRVVRQHVADQEPPARPEHPRRLAEDGGRGRARGAAPASASPRPATRRRAAALRAPRGAPRRWRGRRTPAPAACSISADASIATTLRDVRRHEADSAPVPQPRSPTRPRRRPASRAAPGDELARRTARRAACPTGRPRSAKNACDAVWRRASTPFSRRPSWSRGAGRHRPARAAAPRADGSRAPRSSSARL